jgi:rod shape-determining protein MreC
LTLEHTEHKPMFTRGPSLGTRLFLLLVASVLLMVLDHQRSALESVRGTLSVVVSPIRFVVDLPFRIGYWASESLSTRNRLQKDNKVMRRERLENLVQLQRLDALEAENARLRALLDSSPDVADRILVARILSVDLDPFSHKLLLNKGGLHEVYVGQAMLDADGIVGQITRVDPLYAQAILITDPGHATPVEVNRNGLRTIALGTGDATRISLPFLPNNADIREGDLLVSSGLGGAFPAGYPVARILNVDRRPGEPFADINAEPTGALNREREVLLVWSGPAADPDKEILDATEEALEPAPDVEDKADEANEANQDETGVESGQEVG